jgi:putative ABC transport system substrate-binding protein
VQGSPELGGFLDALRGSGYVPGETIRLEYRWNGGEELRRDLAELIGAGAEVLVAVAGVVARAAREATERVPIVMLAGGDPVGAGLVASLAHPGGNVTGLTALVPQLANKRLELLQATVPDASRVGVLWNTEFADEADLDGLHAAAGPLGLELLPFRLTPVLFYRELVPVAEAARDGRIQALLVAFQPVLGVRRSILDLTSSRRLPAMFPSRDMAEAGGLLAYGPSLPEQFRRAATYVDRILKGAKPADLPVEQPMNFDLVVNLKTAQAFGLTIPQSVLQQATEIIQ